MKSFWIVLLSVVSVIALSARELQEHATPPYTLRPGLTNKDFLLFDSGKEKAEIRHIKTSDYEGYILERVNEPVPLMMKDIQWVENVTKMLMESRFKESSQGRIQDYYILDHYSEYLRQYINISTKEEVIVLINFVDPLLKHTDFSKKIFILGGGTGRAGWRVKVNLTTKKIEELKLF